MQYVMHLRLDETLASVNI